MVINHKYPITHFLLADVVISVLIFLFSAVFPAEAAGIDDDMLLQYELHGHRAQPIAIKRDIKAETSSFDSYIDETGTISRELWPYIDSSLVDERTILSMDVGVTRIVLLLSNDNHSVIVRIEKWNDELQTYMRI